MQLLFFWKVRFLSPTAYKGARISISLIGGEKRFVIPFDYEDDLIVTTASKFLNKNDVIGFNSVKKNSSEYIIATKYDLI